jgi:hypothetical protein
MRNRCEVEGKEEWLEGREPHQGIYSGINKQCDDDMEYRERRLAINLWLIIRTLVVDISGWRFKRLKKKKELERGAKEMKEVLHTSYFSSPRYSTRISSLPSLRESD